MPPNQALDTNTILCVGGGGEIHVEFVASGVFEPT